jgi:hypothetical protein
MMPFIFSPFFNDPVLDFLGSDELQNGLREQPEASGSELKAQTHARTDGVEQIDDLARQLAA